MQNARKSVHRSANVRKNRTRNKAQNRSAAGKHPMAVLARRMSLFMGLAVVALLWGATGVHAAPLLQDASSSPAIGEAFAPLLAAAVSVERVVEIGWNYVEWGVVRYAGWRADELKTPQYAQFKSASSTVAAIVLGIIVVNYSNLRLFAFMQPELGSFASNVPAAWDIILTGLLVGAGSKPAHDILGLITRFKSLVGNTSLRQREEAGSAVADYVLKLGQADAVSSMDVPGTRGVSSSRHGTPQDYISLVRGRLEDSYGG
ncbi:MAG: hypothetical protein KBG20_08435 [Caldilineaceae bacterium]|nr:hypothetical protein [Caldilineaceae bacterium]MBP8124545.1 hypothetical protein [Caldilineaceae bacterium]MBP9072311.1 hypothetical protein [Caldilineaceae bacterium]